MRFNRYVDECPFCSHFYQNCDVKLRELLIESNVECSLEQNTNSVEKCMFFYVGDPDINLLEGKHERCPSTRAHCRRGNPEFHHPKLARG